MKKIVCAVVLTFFAACIVCGQRKEIYTHPRFDSIAKDHFLLAILPFDVTINLRPAQKKKLKEGELENLERTEGDSVQSAIQTYFLNQKTKKEFKVNFQDISTTNALLAKNNWTVDSFKVKTREEICQYLGVDGIISGTLLTDKPISEEVYLILSGWIPVKTNSGICTINVHEGEAGELLWKYEKKLSRGLGSGINSVIEAMMRKASRKFPYEDIK
ncbi:MAG: hypothetical protein ACHQFX_16140 [Chitinophagales bacterium]